MTLAGVPCAMVRVSGPGEESGKVWPQRGVQTKTTSMTKQRLVEMPSRRFKKNLQGYMKKRGGRDERDVCLTLMRYDDAPHRGIQPSGSKGKEEGQN